MGICLNAGGITVLSLTTSSLVGVSRAPHTRKTSSRARTCHCGCIARRTVVQVSRLEVVCFPAKKKLLHSSTMSCTVILDDGHQLISPFLTVSSIISPNKSFGHFSGFSFHLFSFRRSISFTSDFFISLSNFQEFMFLLVGRNLIIFIKKKYFSTINSPLIS